MSTNLGLHQATDMFERDLLEITEEGLMVGDQYNTREKEAEHETMGVDIIEKESEDDDQLQEEGYKKKQRTKTSKVWDEMKIIKLGAIEKIQCNHCKELTKLTSCTTTHLRRHLRNCLKRKSCFAGQSKKKQQVLAFTETSNDGNTSITDGRRASMSVDTVQMLLCAGDWVRNIHGMSRNIQDERVEELANAFEKIAVPDSA